MPRIARFFIIVLVVALGLGLRLRAVNLLPIDYDEDDYLGAAQRYAQAIRTHDLRTMIDYAYNFEHPPLTKILYGLSILPLPEAPLIPQLSSTLPPASQLPQPHLRYARTLAATFGTLEVLALAILNPLAGLFLAIHTWQIKYTSQVMLEAFPALTSLLMVMFYYKWRQRYEPGSSALQSTGRGAGWLAASAIAFGLTAASKYPYCLAGVAVLVDWSYSVFRSPSNPLKKQRFHWIAILLVWILLAVIVFFAFNPRLWQDPLHRLAQTLFYHMDYSQSAHVKSANYPPWQPLVWLAGPVPWHPGVFIFTFDFFISLLAVLGFKRLWAHYRVFALWLVITLGFLLVWSTKWPQYILILTAPLCLAAAEGFRGSLWEPLINRINRSKPGTSEDVSPSAKDETQLAKRIARRDARRALPWLLPGILALSLIIIVPLIFQLAIALTDFQSLSFRDGLHGGIWRALLQGLTGQLPSLTQASTRLQQVHFVGPSTLIWVFSGGVPDLLVFNVLWVTLSVALQALLGIGVALILNHPGVRLRKLYRTIFILPWAIPEFIGALIWLRILEPQTGWLYMAQNIPRDVHLPDWTLNPTHTLVVLLVAATWYGFPFIFLATTASLKLLPREVYDAAAIDGASGWKQFRWITWPLLVPLVVPAIIIRSIFAFNQFYLFISLRTNPPMMTFSTLSYLIFSPTGRFGGRFALSAVVNIFTVVVLLVLILWFNRMSKAAEGVDYA
jgi:ABC-type sugar transport system permease subunit